MSEAAGRRTQAQRRAEAEHRVLEAAKEVIAQSGVAAVTFAAVGARAGYSRGIVTHHFGSRRALMETLARSLQDLVTPAPAGLPGRERVLAQVDLYLATLEHRARDTRVFAMLWAEAIAGDPDLRPIFAERDAEFRAGFSRSLRGAIDDGTIAGADPDAAATAIVGLLRGVGLQLVLMQRAPDFGALRSEVARLLGAGLA